MKNGININNEPYSNNDTALFTELTKEEQKTTLDWIASNIEKRKTVNNDHTSYGLKHILERATKIYMTNNQFKHAMLLAGFIPDDYSDLNWKFCISQKSPAFKSNN